MLIQSEFMKSKIPIITIEQLNSCDSHISMNVDIRRLEDHVRTLKESDFPHRHDFFNLIYIAQGSGTHDIDYCRYYVKPKQMFFMNDGQVHDWSFSDDTIGYTLFFKKEFYEVIEKKLSLPALPFFNLNSNNIPYVVFSDEQSVILEQFFEMILKEFKEAKLYNESVIKLILKMILINSLRIYENCNPQNASSLNFTKIHKFETLIDQNYKSIKSVKDYASLLNISAYYLNAICKDTLGRTSGDMIRDRVILEAKRLLLHTSISVCEAAYQLGYEDCSYFIRLFKKNTELSPEKFRTLKNQKNAQ